MHHLMRKEPVLSGYICAYNVTVLNEHIPGGKNVAAGAQPCNNDDGANKYLAKRHAGSTKLIHIKVRGSMYVPNFCTYYVYIYIF